MALALTRGRYDLLIQAYSRENELLHGRETFEVGAEEMIREIKLSPGIPVTGTIALQDVDGNRLNLPPVLCRLVSRAPVASAQLSPHGCLQSQVSPGTYQLEMEAMPPDAYVAAARSGEQDILRDGIRIDGPVHLDIALATPGARIVGVVRNESGVPLSHATIGLVPDAPYREALARYRVDMSAYDGTFELRGIAPGSYQIFAWSDLTGAGYRNIEFMTRYEGMGKSIRIEKVQQMVVDLTALN